MLIYCLDRMKFILLIATSVIICVACHQESQNDKISTQSGSIDVNNQPIQKNKSKYEIVCFLIDSLNPQNGFGYDILMDGSRFIHQVNIPSIQGNYGFSTKEKAEAVAHLMIHKLEHNIMPPSVSKKELDSLQILN